MAEIGVREVQSGAAELIELGGRQGADGDLRRGARAVLKLVVEDAVAGADGPFAVARRIPGHADARHERIVAVRDALGDAGIAGKEQAGGGIGINRGLHAGHESRSGDFDFGDRIDALIPDPVVEGEARADAPLVLRIQAEAPVTQTAVEIRRAPGRKSPGAPSRRLAIASLVGKVEAKMKKELGAMP